jgi:hypothetical protein
MSKIEVNAVEPQCGTTLTLGANNDKITLGTGASFGGGVAAIKWETTPQTGDFGALSGRGYFVNTTSGARTVTLPASPSAGDFLAVSDYNSTAGTNNITIARNGSNINGSASNLVISKANSAIQLVYVDATTGWQGVATASEGDILNTFVAATGGTITTCGDFKIHTFTGPGTFTVTSGGTASGSNAVDYLVVAGGGGASSAGGGAGGYRESCGTCYTSSPLGACVSALPVTAQAYPITVGGGGSAGAPVSNLGGTGNNSIFSTITSAGGGGGRALDSTGQDGGSGSGASGGGSSGNRAGGDGNTPPVSPPQGNNGGTSAPAPGAGGAGGGATSVGANASGTNGGNGGNGATSSINGTPTARAGGGGSGMYGPSGSGGGGGPGGGGVGSGSNTGTGTAGTANTGGGGGGGGGNCGGIRGNGAAGGSGVVIIRYKFQ